MNHTKLYAATVLLTCAFGFNGLAKAQATESTRTDRTKTPTVLDADKPQLADDADVVEEARPVAPAPQIVPRAHGQVITPQSSMPVKGAFAHTNYKIFVPQGHSMVSATPDTTFAETPASLGCVYKVENTYSGCNPATGGSHHPAGGWGAIAVVDAYDDPHAAADLAYFDSYWGLATPRFSVVKANSSFGTLNGLTASCSGTPPNANAYGWDLEESLDIEWAHVFAPNAKIYLIEACSSSLNDLLYAEQVAGAQVDLYGGGEISNSWGTAESNLTAATQFGYDNNFFRYHWSDINYFASTGDTGSEVSYPATSPWVVSAGGTTINRDANGNFVSESCWADSGGGTSTNETWATTPSISAGMGPWTSYQYPTFGITPRSTPDISFDADPNSGVWVRDTDPTNGGGWYVVGGTSLSSPALAGMVNSSNQKFGQATTAAGGYYITAELNFLYSQLHANVAYPANFYDVTTGSNGHAAGAGYDQCTGIGSPRGKNGN